MPTTTDYCSLSELGFEVSGGLTTGDFYAINVEENERGTGLRLLTSGGIDPDVSYWGHKTHRQKFNRKRYRFPRITDGNYSKGLNAKLKRSRRPKLIIANLTKKMEVFLDESGEYQAATGTQSIYHKQNDVEKLNQLKIIFHSPYGNILFHAILAYNAMHENISVEKRYLENFPIPIDYNEQTRSMHE